MASITTRAGKGSPLTNAELDANFTNINDGITTAAAITGGTINGTTIGATVPTTGVFSEIDVDNLELNGNAIISTNVNGNIDLTPNGTGAVNITKLNVTGIATLATGAVLGTPSSGTVTNLTGTASININGTVGATTATTGAFTSVTATSVTNSGLTSGRVTFASTAGLLADSANLTWSGTALNVTGTVAVTGALTATLDSTFSSTGALTISKGTTGERPSAVSGMLRFNTTTTEFEGYNGTAWASVGGAALSNDTSTASNLFPLFATATSGTASTLNTSNAKLLYKPSTGEFQASVPVALNGLFVNSATVSADYSIPAGSNAMSSGPVSVDSGITVTIPSGSNWVVL